MKKVVLLGDSIRYIGYGTVVPELLSDCEVWQPNDNCRFAKYTLRGIFEWRENIKGADVIHWNNGLWDTCNLFDDGTFSSLPEYIDTMVRIARILKKITPNVIFATITPVRDDKEYISNTDIIEFNKAIVPILEKEGVVINDLHSLLYENRNDFILESDKIHLNELGIKVCSDAVVNKIKSLL